MFAADQAFIISGPTCSGKSSLALKLASRINGAIINLDSQQIYRGFDIGTAKPSAEDMAGIPHYLYDVVNADQTYSVVAYRRAVRDVLNKAREKHQIPIFVGGTTFYANVLLRGISDLPAADPEIRAQLSQLDLAQLQQQLLQLDPSAKKSIVDFKNSRRVQRSLEIVLQTKLPLKTAFEKTFLPPVLNLSETKLIITQPDREKLRAKIAERAVGMVAAGLEEETRDLQTRYGKVPALNSIGYQEMLQFLAGELTSQETIDSISLHTAQYAKKQQTFWNNFPAKNNLRAIKTPRESFPKQLTSKQLLTELASRPELIYLRD